MAKAASGKILRAVCRVVDDERTRELSDRDLLEQFIGRGDEGAFAALLRRHGPTVLSVCRALLPNQSDAEDAFQATFLILVRKARSIRKTRSLGSWLHGVAYRTARRAQADFAKRKKHEPRAARPEALSSDDMTWLEVQRVVHQELGELSERHRAPLILCYLQGHTLDESAAQLGLAKSTLKMRLERGRAILRARLVRRGLGPTAVLLASAWPAAMAAAVRMDLVNTTARLATAVLAGRGPAAVSQGVAVMVQRGLCAASGSTWQALAAGVIMCFGLASLGAVWSSAQNPRGKPVSGAEQAQAHAKPVDRAENKTAERLPEGAIARLGTLRFNHGDGLISLHYTPDGKTIVSYGGGFLRLWNPETGEELKHLATPKPFSDDQTVLLDGGKTLLSLSQDMDDTLRFWDLDQGKEIRAIDLGIRRRLISVYIRNALSPDGQLAAVHTQEAVRIFETTSGKERFRTDKRGEDVRAVVFSGDSKMLVQSGKDGGLEVWDTAGKRLKMFAQTPPAQVLATSADGRWLATLEHHNHAIDRRLDKDVIHLWDLHEAKEVRTFAGKGWFMRLQFTPDSKRLVAHSSTEDSYSSYGWELASGAPIRNLLPELASARAFHPDGKRFLAGGAQFQQWDSTTGKRLVPEDPPYAWARALSFAGDGRVHTLGQGWITTWDADTGKRVRTIDVPLYSWEPPRPVLSSDGKFALTYRRTGKYYEFDFLLWDIARGTSTKLAMKEVAQDSINAHLLMRPVFTPDGTLLLGRHPVRNEETLIRIWDTKTGRESRQIPGTKAGAGWTIFLLADGKTVVGVGSQAVGLDLASGRELFAWKAPVRLRSKVGIAPKGGPPPDPDAGPAWSSFAISADGKTAAYVLAADFGSERVPERIVVCEGKTGRLLHRLDDSGLRGRDLDELAFSPDGRILASTDRKVTHLWDVATGKKLRTLSGHRGDIQALAFSQSGRRLATASSDSTVLIWDIAKD